MAVRAGTPKPDISTPEALKRALLAARAISYSNPAAGGASGVHMGKVVERLGLIDELKAKTKFPPPGGFTVDLLRKGEVDLAFQQIPELKGDGVELVGPLPGDLQSMTVFAAGVLTGATNKDVAGELVKFLRSPEAAEVMRKQGMEPSS
jgi:molybdate transport system substrate-binding protein